MIFLIRWKPYPDLGGSIKKNFFLIASSLSLAPKTGLLPQHLIEQLIRPFLGFPEPLHFNYIILLFSCLIVESRQHTVAALLILK